MEFQMIETMALDAGFTYAVYLDAATVRLREEVREMCQSNTCGMYGKNWACPPACGDLDTCREQVAAYRWGVLLQTVGEVEDSLDFEGMMAAEAAHKKSFYTLIPLLRRKYPGLLALGSGCCTVCPQCAGPEVPCRFPEKRVSSLEAYGVVVSDLCKENHIGYYYGSGTIAYTACCLLA